jgi:hypothetical protein
MDFSNYLANATINATTRGVPYAPPVKVYVSLYTTDPTKDDTGLEVSGSGGTYSREELKLGQPFDGVSTNENLMQWNTATTDWGVITHVAIHDSETGGNMLYYTPLDVPKNIEVGDQFQITVSNLKLTLS